MLFSFSTLYHSLIQYIGNFPAILVTGVTGHATIVLERPSRVNLTASADSAVIVDRPPMIVMNSALQQPRLSSMTVVSAGIIVLVIAPQVIVMLSGSSVVSAVV